MSIRFSCPSCNGQISAPERLAGKRAKCPNCQQAFLVPAASSRQAQAGESSVRPGQPSDTSAPVPGKAEPAAEATVLPPVTPGQQAAHTPPSQPPLPVPAPQPLAEAPGSEHVSRVPQPHQVNVQVGMTSPMPASEQTIWQGRPALGYHVVGFVWSGLWILVWLVLAANGSEIFFWLRAFATRTFPAAEADLANANLKPIYLTGALLVLLLMAVWRLVRRVLIYISSYYIFTNQRLRIRKGILSQKYMHMELFRVKDLFVEHTLLGRLLDYAHVRILSSDRIVGDVTVYGLPGGVETAEKIRLASQWARSQSGMTTIRE